MWCVGGWHLRIWIEKPLHKQSSRRLNSSQGYIRLENKYGRVICQGYIPMLLNVIQKKLLRLVTNMRFNVNYAVKFTVITTADTVYCGSSDDPWFKSLKRLWKHWFYWCDNKTELPSGLWLYLYCWKKWWLRESHTSQQANFEIKQINNLTELPQARNTAL